MRKSKEIVVYSEDWCDDIPEEASDFMEFWRSKLDGIPAEFRDSAMIKIDAAHYGDCAALYVDIRYTRPETDSEMESREQRDKEMDDRYKARKLEKYNKLKQELGL